MAGHLPTLKQMIDTALEEHSYEAGLLEVRDETWNFRGEGAKRAADYLIGKYTELTGLARPETKEEKTLPAG